MSDNCMVTAACGHDASKFVRPSSAWVVDHVFGDGA
jgi:hypothetical protein